MKMLSGRQYSLNDDGTTERFASLEAEQTSVPLHKIPTRAPEHFHCTVIRRVAMDIRNYR